MKTLLVKTSLPTAFLAGALCGAALISTASANVEVPLLFQNHAVLQCEKPLPIWGRADAGEKVTVTFAGQSLTTVTGADGSWRVVFPPLAANSTPQTLTVTGNNTLSFEDVVVGELWLCSGQSNMDFPLGRAKNAEQEVANANFPLIRQFSVSFGLSNTPETTVRGDWAVASPKNAARFTAVGYFFAREVHQKLGGPVGLIASTWGGTDIEAWMSGDSIASNPDLKFVGEHWQQRLDEYPARMAKYDADVAQWQKQSDEAKANGTPFYRGKPGEPPNPDGRPHSTKTSAIYNTKIAPFTPAALRGVLWYQGENNAGRPAEYEKLFPALITGWRQAFGQESLPFFWVQLPNFQGNFVGLREAQSKTLSLPATGQAITIDVGEVNDIHPSNKQPVGERLARLALHRVYGQKIVDSGPIVRSAKLGNGVARLEFDHTEGGLKFEGETLSGFEIAGADKKFVPAPAQIEGATVIVSAPEVPVPVAVRYAWKNAPTANLYNVEGLPASPFRSDNW